VQTTDEVTFWLGGQRTATYSLSFVSGTLQATQTGTWYYFAGKLIKNANGYVHTDRLGSIGKFYPYGQERVPTQNGTNSPLIFGIQRRASIMRTRGIIRREWGGF
jgi:hypothetical protein